MTVSKELPNIKKPFSLLHFFLQKHGFKKTRREGEDVYEVWFEDVCTHREYCLVIPVQTFGEESTVRLKKAFFNESDIPSAIREAGRSKLKEIADYLHQIY